MHLCCRPLLFSLSRLKLLIPLLQLTICRFFLTRKQLAQEKDKELRGVAAEALKELEETFSKGMALVAENREHSGIKPQADRGAAVP